jgi:drug/metabolite transporter (DMT)-like permease
MTPLTIALVMAAALAHATWNLMAKRAAQVGPVFVAAYNFVACVAYAPWALWLVASGRVPWSTPLVIALLASGLIHLAYSLALQRGYRVADLSVVYPVARGTGPLIASLGAFVILGEPASPLGVAGLLAVVTGIGLVSTDGRLAAFAKPGGRAGVAWGGATGGLIAAYTVVDGYAVKVLGVPPVVLDWSSNLLRFVLLSPMVARDPAGALAQMRGYWRLALGVGLLSPLGYIIILAALAQGAPLSVVAPMREMSMMLGAFLGMLVLGETVGPWRLAGCAVMIAGVVMLGMS